MKRLPRTIQSPCHGLRCLDGYFGISSVLTGPLFWKTNITGSFYAFHFFHPHVSNFKVLDNGIFQYFEFEKCFVIKYSDKGRL